MATTVKLTKILQQGGKVILSWDDGSNDEFNSVQEVREWAGSIDDNVDFTKRLDVALWIKNNPNGTNQAQIVNHAFTFDLTATPVINRV